MWTRLLSLQSPFQTQIISTNNDRELIYVSLNSHIRIYDIYQNTWKLAFISNNTEHNNTDLTICNNTEQLILYESKNHVFQEFIHQTKPQIKSSYFITERPQIGEGSIIFKIKDTFHIIGGIFSNKHYTYNAKTNEFKQIYEWPNIEYLAGHQVIFIKDSNNLALILLFTTKIYRFDIKHFIWNQLNVEIPQTVWSHFGAAVTTKEDVIVIIGGITEIDDIFVDNIYLYDIKKQHFTLSTIKAPSAASYQAVIVNDFQTDSFLYAITNRFVCSAYCNQSILYPIAMIKYITKFVCKEHIHLFSWEHNKHHKLNVDKLFECII